MIKIGELQDEEHLKSILSCLAIGSGMRILDLGCGSGYLTFSIAKSNSKNEVIGLDIVTNTLQENAVKAYNEGYINLEFLSYDRNKFPFEDHYFDCISGTTTFRIRHLSCLKTLR